MANQVDGQSVGRMVAVTAGDGTRFNVTIGLSVNVTGDVSILCCNNTAPVVMTLNSGQMYPIRAIGVYSTSTTATGIVAHYQN